MQFSKLLSILLKKHSFHVNSPHIVEYKEDPSSPDFL